MTMTTKKKIGEKKRTKMFVGLSSCLRKKQQNDVVTKYDQSTMLHEQEQPKDQPSDNINGLDSTLGTRTQQQIQSSPSMRREEENPDGMTTKPRTEWIEEIVKQLANKDVCKVVVHGKQGVGKTWIAKQVTRQALLNKLVEVKIWVYFNTNTDDNTSTICAKENHGKLYKSIVRQLSVQQDIDGGEYYLIDDEKPDDYFLASLKDMLEGKTYLLVLDNVDPENVDVQDVMRLMNKILGSGNTKLSKVLLTTLAKNDMMMKTDDETNRRAVDVEIKPLMLSESTDLLCRSITIPDGLDVKDVVKHCKYLPAAIMLTQNLLFYALSNAANDVIKTELVSEAKKQVDDYWVLGYEKFKNDVSLLRCFLHSTFYLKKHGSMHYNELILAWILEGYFLLDSTPASLEKDYAHGHNVLMDLLDAGLLGEREADDVVLEKAGLNFANYLIPAFLSENKQLIISCDLNEVKGRGNVKYRNGSIAAFTKSGEENYEVNLVALSVDRNGVSTEDQVMINNSQNVISSIKVLSVYNNVDPITSLKLMSKNLRVLKLRGCQSVNNPVMVSDITSLINLEISECSTLENIPSDFFGRFVGLRSLNLSGTCIKSLPKLSSSDSITKTLRSLILRRCRQLECFPDVNDLEELQVLDLSGSKSSPKDNSWMLDRLHKLEVLDLSETDIYETPNLVKLKNLACLLLRNCPKLNKLKPVTELAKLQVIDISGSKGLRYLRKHNLPSYESLRKLDLASTAISEIPFEMNNASNLVYLCLKGCDQLKKLPLIQGAKNLRVLDVSDATQLKKINDNASFFRDMQSLQEILLPNTAIDTLPPLSGLNSLRKLILRGCPLLKSLPEMDMLINLAHLDVRDCPSLNKNQKFNHHCEILKD